MILVKPSTEILAVTAGALELIETAGRTCYKSEGKITADSAPDFVRMIMKRGTNPCSNMALQPLDSSVTVA